MTIEVTRPDVEQLLQQGLGSGRFQTIDDLLATALLALNVKEPVRALGPSGGKRRTLVDLFEPVMGLGPDLDFSRDRSEARLLDL